VSDIVLSNSVRQNLLSLQSTAELLATTQSRLSTGKKVNTALDNPTNYFTAATLDARASDINNLLDGIGNGVQVLQAANTGITSLQKLIDSAKSIANQALQTTVGYSTKSHVSATIPGATPSDLRGTTAYANAIASSNVLYSGATGGATAATSGMTLGGSQGAVTGTSVLDNASTAASISSGTLIFGASGALTTAASTSFADGDVFTVNGKTITLRTGSAPASSAVPSGSGVSGNIVTDGAGNSTVYLNAATNVGDILTAFDLASNIKTATISSGAATLATTAGLTASSVNGTGQVILRSSTGSDLQVTGKADSLKALGLTTATGAGNATVQANRTTSGTSLGSLIAPGSTLNVDGKVITFKDAAPPASASLASGYGLAGNLVTDGTGNSTVYLQGGSIADVLKAIDLATGTQTATLSGGAATLATGSGLTASSVNASGNLKVSTGVNADLSITGTGNALAALGLAGNTGTGTGFTAARNSGVGGIVGKTLTFTSFNGGTAVNVTFGDGTNGTIKTLDQLNKVLLGNNLAATLDPSGVLTVSVAADYASSTLGSAANGGAIGGTLTSALTFSSAEPPVADVNAQATRAALVVQYNNILAQINTTAQDASFNGVNLLNGDQLKLVFNESGSSVLSITGLIFDTTGLGLANLTQGIDFIDNAATGKVLSSLSAAAGTLRSQASALGSNLSIVQIRQTFAKNLINVLQTGSSNLTLADTNVEAANSQALSTRQSIAVSALALANTSQQSVLQLLR